MLKFSSDFVDDEKANVLIKKFINNRLINLVEPYETDYLDIAVDLFPENYNHKNVSLKIKELLDLLQDEEEHVPELLLEYVLYYIIKFEMDYIRDNSNSEQVNIFVEKIPEDRNYVIQKMKEYYIVNNDYGESDENQTLEEYVECLVSSAMMSIEDLSCYEDTCFWDMDYAFIDQVGYDEAVNFFNNNDFL
jgi:hypothetical protein